MKQRARGLGLDFTGETGPANAITDVGGVLVGATTRIEGEGELVPGRGPVRTGVTAILPRGRRPDPQPVWAGIHALNGNGEMTGSHWVRDGGYLLGPICLTNTHSVGTVHHAATSWSIRTYAAHWGDEHVWAMPVVAETYDGVLNDINGQHVTEADALAAIDGAGEVVAEGNVGGGTGMICYEFKGGTGTASRRVTMAGERYTTGVLVQANHGIRPWFTALGVPVGRHLTEHRLLGDCEHGSIIVIIGTDAPLLPHQLERLARRATIGIGRGGTPGGNGSGDIFLAFSVANPVSLPQLPPRLQLECLNDNELDALYLGTVEAVEESVLNALLAAEDMSTLRPAGSVCRALDHGRFVAIMQRYGRCG